MKTFKIEKTGAFMTKLLSKTDFDNYLLCMAKITLANSYTVDGRLHPDFFDSDERKNLADEFVSWAGIRPLYYEIIKGKKLPLSMNITLYLPSADMEQFTASLSSDELSTVHYFALSIRYDANSLLVISSVERTTFSLKKEADEIWDEQVKEFLSSLDISYDEI